MKRSISVTLVGITAFLGSLLTLALIIFAAAISAFSSASNSDTMAPDVKTAGMIGLAFVTLLSIWGIATGIAVFFLKRWARISIIVFGVFLIFVGFFGGLMILVIPLPSTDPNALGSFVAIKLGIAVFYLLIGAMGLWWVLLFNSRSVRTQFAGDQLVEEARPAQYLNYCLAVYRWLSVFTAYSA